MCVSNNYVFLSLKFILQIIIPELNSCVHCNQLCNSWLNPRSTCAQACDWIAMWAVWGQVHTVSLCLLNGITVVGVLSPGGASWLGCNPLLWLEQWHVSHFNGCLNSVNDEKKSILKRLPLFITHFTKSWD